MGAPTFTKEQLEKLKAAYASGVLRVRLNELELSYQTGAEMLKAIRVIENELNKEEKRFSITPKFERGL